MPSTASFPGSRRRILEDTSECFIRRSNNKSHSPMNAQEGECARLVTTNKAGRREVIALTLDRPVTIGRDPCECTYVIEDKVVSSIHCKFYAVLSSTGGVLVSCHDNSTNGVILNGYKLHRTAALVMDGDEVVIPSSRAFKCIHILKEPHDQLNIFEPTPPQGIYKNVRVGRYTIVSHCLGRRARIASFRLTGQLLMLTDSGSFASVHLAFDTVSSCQVACKTILTRSRGRDEMQKAITEVNILRKLKHPNICGILDVKQNDKAGWLHIFLELCTGGDLFTYTMRHYILCEAEAKFIAYQIFKAMEYLHVRSISHRDLKPENILLFSPGPFPKVQIADFGLARTSAYQETLTVCGTVSYLPPEGILALDNKELTYVGMPADCWSVGLILFIMLTGMHPFDYQEGEINANGSLKPTSQRSMVSEEIVKGRIIKCGVEFSYVWDNMQDAKDLVEGLLIRDHSRRMSIQDALQSHWITRDFDELLHDYNERMLN